MDIEMKKEDKKIKSQYEAPEVNSIELSSIVRGGTSALPPDGFAAPADPRQT